MTPLEITENIVLTDEWYMARSGNSVDIKCLYAPVSVPVVTLAFDPSNSVDLSSVLMVARNITRDHNRRIP